MTTLEGALPSPDNDDWIDFLNWYADNYALAPRLIVAVVEKPHNYGECYREYLSEGGVDR